MSDSPSAAAAAEHSLSEVTSRRGEHALELEELENGTILYPYRAMPPAQQHNEGRRLQEATPGSTWTRDPFPVPVFWGKTTSETPVPWHITGIFYLLPVARVPSAQLHDELRERSIFSSRSLMDTFVIA